MAIWKNIEIENERGECITDWMDSEYDSGRISKHAKEFAREAWDQRKFLWPIYK